MKKKKNWIIPFVAFGFVLILASSCNALTVGKDYQGGKIAYIFKEGDQGYIKGETHGLIVAPNDQSSSTCWYNGNYIKTGARNWEKVGGGKENTEIIVRKQGNGNYAAKLCYDLDLNGYKDWYLPCVNELWKLYNNRSKIGGFTESLYWSSTETLNDNSNSGAQGFEFRSESGITAGAGNYNKNAKFHVRAVRTF